jgi:CBS domain-containing protein
VVDEEGRPIGWLSERDLELDTVLPQPNTPPDPILELEDVVRDALSNLLRSDTQYGPVVDEQGRLVGVLSVEIISHFLSSDRAVELATGPAERVTS